jgi:UDP-2,3-diacylglucosamine pyrophosphatase LpxH
MIKCVGFLTDTHIPFHSRRALAVALNVLADSRLSALYLGGDILDMYWCHGHGPKHPAVRSTLELERDEGVMFLDMLDKTFPGIPKHFIEGNHETRFERFLVQHAPALFSLTSMRHLLEMDRRKNWKYYDFGPNQLVQIEKTSLFAKHAPKGSSGSTILTAASCNLIFGHVHRIIQERRVTADRRILSATSPGWLGDERRDQVFGYVAGHHNWQTGFARIFIDTTTNDFWIDVHEIKNGVCVANGRLYR